MNAKMKTLKIVYKTQIVVRKVWIKDQVKSSISSHTLQSHLYGRLQSPWYTPASLVLNILPQMQN